MAVGNVDLARQGAASRSDFIDVDTGRTRHRVLSVGIFSAEAHAVKYISKLTKQNLCAIMRTQTGADWYDRLVESLKVRAMLNLNSIMIGTEKPKELAEFYAKVLGKPADMMEDDAYGWAVGNTFLNVGKHSEVKGKAKEPQRVMLNLETKDVQAEFERIRSVGATIIKEPYEMQGMWIATFADPDGNYLQLMSPWEEEKP